MTVSIIGSGNVATHIALRLFSHKVSIDQIVSPNADHADALASKVSSIGTTSINSSLDNSDVVLMCVSDSAIGDVADSLFQKHIISPVVTHTAGSISSELLMPFPKYGVIYPLQTFSASKPVDWQQIPVLITPGNPGSAKALTDLADQLSGKVRSITDSERLVLHLCATIANNFSNQMFAIAEEIAEQHHLDFDLLHPLILETARKVQSMSPREAQTGAAVRDDKVTMQKHLDLLADRQDLSGLYRMLSKSIIRLHSEK